MSTLGQIASLVVLILSITLLGMFVEAIVSAIRRSIQRRRRERDWCKGANWYD